MLQYIYSVIKNLAVFFIVTQMILHILPGEHFKKYVRLIIGLFIILYILSPISKVMNLKDKIAIRGFRDTFESRLSETQPNYEKMEEVYSENMLSTYEEKIKFKINNIISEYEMTVKTAKLGELVKIEKENYAKFSDLELVLQKDVDKSANITVNKIIVTQNENISDKELKREVQGIIAEQLEMDVKSINIRIEN